MLEQLINSLLELYRQDILDYTEMEKKMEDFRAFLNLKEEKSPIQDHSDNSDLDEYERKIEEFTLHRQELFRRLKERAAYEAGIQKQACAEIGESTFRTASFEAYLPENIYKELSFLTEAIRKEMARILEMDKEILGKLQLELDELRQEFYRIEGLKKTRNAYGSKYSTDARFIDRKK